MSRSAAPALNRRYASGCAGQFTVGRAGGAEALVRPAAVVRFIVGGTVPNNYYLVNQILRWRVENVVESPLVMPRTVPVRSLKIAEELCARVDRVCSLHGGISFNAGTELLLRQMLDLVETEPRERTVPPIALALDAIRSTRPPLNSRAVALADQAARDALAAVTKAKK